MRYPIHSTNISRPKQPAIFSTGLFPLLLLACLVLAARADEFAEKGRIVFQKNHAAVVTVEVVQKAPAGRSGAPRESKVDLTGTIIDPSGLTVLALSSVDPSELYRRLSEESKLEIEVSEVKMLLQDGTEVPADIVRRDKDLDLAFVRPKTKPASPMAAVDLSKSGTAQVLDQVISLNRLKQASGRAYSASEERIAAVVQKPRTFYIPDSSLTETESGSPAFTLDGGVLGLFVMRAVNAAGAGNIRDCYTAIILPAGDIIEDAKQVPAEGKAEDEKKDAPKEPAAAPEAVK
jgi:S1-C subfamily serine protease